VFANPEVSAFIDRLIGGQTPRGGAPPPTPGYRGALARGLFGEMTKPAIRGGFSAPAIEASRHPLTQPLPSEGVGRSGGSQVLEQSEVRGGGGNTGASGLAAGIGKVGAGIESGLEQLAANKQAADEKAALSQGGAFPKFGGGVSDSGGGTGGNTGTAPIFSQPGVSQGAGTGSYAPFAGMSPAQSRAYDFFVGKGWSPNLSIAMTAALTGESTPALNTAPLQGNDARIGGGNGIANWSASRWNQIGRPQGLENQLNAVYNEVQQKYPNIAALASSNSDPATLTNMITGGVTGGGRNGSPFAGSYLTPQVANGYNRWLAFSKVTGLGGPPSPGTSSASAPLTAGTSSTSPSFASVPLTVGPSSTSPSLAAADMAQDAKQDAQDLQHPTPSGASTTPPAGPTLGGPVQSGIYGGQPYTYQTQPALGPQGMLMPPQAQPAAPQIDPLALALAGGQMPPIDPNFGGLPSGLFG
jgi:hypothetical protein